MKERTGRQAREEEPDATRSKLWQKKAVPVSFF